MSKNDFDKTSKLKDAGNIVVVSQNDGTEYVSPSPGEFPILGSTICVNYKEPVRSEFLTARDCGISAGSTPVKYNNNDAEVASGALTSKFKPALLNTGVGLVVNNASLIRSYDDKIYQFAFDDPAVASSYNVRMNYTVQQPFVTGIGVGDEPTWEKFVESGNPLINLSTCVEGPYTKTYKIARNRMIFNCRSKFPVRQLYVNLAAADSKGWIGPWGGENSNYYKYLKAVDKLIEPMCWSFDLYPGVIKAGGKFIYASELKRLYGFLDRFLQISIETNRPFRMICLATEFENGGGDYQASPTINRLRFETFTALAYGAQEIQYWTYCQRKHSDNPSEKDGIFATEFYISSPINRFGVKNQIWYSIQQVNEEIRQFSRVFIGCRVQCIQHLDNNYQSPLKDEMPSNEKPGFSQTYTRPPIRIVKINEPAYEKDNEIFKGVMISYLKRDPDNLSTDSKKNAFSDSEHTEYYVVIVSHDPDNYKNLIIEVKDGFALLELTPHVVCKDSRSMPNYFERDLLPGGYLIFKYTKIY